jgi:hypothetical protein
MRESPWASSSWVRSRPIGVSDAYQVARSWRGTPATSVVCVGKYAHLAVRKGGLITCTAERERSYGY